MVNMNTDPDYGWQSSMDPRIPYTVNYEGRKRGVWAEQKREEPLAPCLSYAKVKGKTYLDMEKSRAGSPGCTEDMILALSKKFHGKVPILSGLEKTIVEEKRMAARASHLSTTATS